MTQKEAAKLLTARFKEIGFSGSYLTMLSPVEVTTFFHKEGWLVIQKTPKFQRFRVVDKAGKTLRGNNKN